MNNFNANCEDIKIAMMALIDGELSEDDKIKVNVHLEKCPSCAKEFESFQSLKQETETMKLAKLPDEYWDDYWERVYNQLERGFGWILFSIGAVIVISFAIYESLKEFFYNPEVSLPLKIGIAFLAFGSVVLFVSVFREKWMVRKVDKYRSVQR
jgi:predicted anti-sigma-YlaC factor YlaD